MKSSRFGSGVTPAGRRRKVQDLESRLLTCMERLQGFDAAAIAKTGYATNLNGAVVYGCLGSA
jgi:hypothetical protein